MEQLVKHLVALAAVSPCSQGDRCIAITQRPTSVLLSIIFFVLNASLKTADGFSHANSHMY